MWVERLPGIRQLNAYQREILIRAVLVCFGAGVWLNFLYTFFVVSLVLAWLLDEHAKTFRQLITEPLVQAILVLCVSLLLGLFWSEASFEGRCKWMKYFLLLVYVPFFALLNRQRLPWVIGAVLAGYCLVLFVGLYMWLVEKQQGIPVFNMTYLTFSAMLGVGSVLACCFACMNRNRIVRICLAVLSLALLYLQFHQGARGFLLATLLTLVIMLIVHFRITFRRLAAMSISVLLVLLLFAYNSPMIQERWAQAEVDFERMQQGHFNSSIGYRIAMWDVGLYGIMQKPFLGHGTGMPKEFFDQTIVEYKQGLYRNLPEFQRTVHYHNDWIELGMQLGILGLGSLLFLFWSWYRTFTTSGQILPGICVLSFVVLSGVTETFMVFGRMPILLLVITAIIVCWQRENQVFPGAGDSRIKSIPDQGCKGD